MQSNAPLRPQGFFKASPSVPLARTASGQNPARLPPTAAAKAMVAGLRAAGIAHETVLAAMLAVPRHAFVDATFAPRAYDNVALPIAFGQTISQPWIVARMLALALEAPCNESFAARRWLEVGTGCGYQAAVMAQCAARVCSIERIAGLHQLATQHLRLIEQTQVQLLHGDGAAGWLDAGAPSGFHAIVVAAAGIEIAPAWLQQLAVGGRLVAPVGPAQGEQQLHVIDRISATQWQRSVQGAVQFVPLLAGVS